MTVALQPKTKVQVILDTVSQVLDRGERLDDIAFARLQREAKAELQNDPFYANVALGGLAAYKFNVDGVRQYHLASRYEGPESLYHANFAVSLAYVGESGEAADHAYEGYLAARDDLAVLDMAIRFSHRAGRMKAVAELLDEYKKLDPTVLDKDAENAQRSTFTFGAFSVLEKRGVTEEDFQIGLAVAERLLVAKKIPSTTRIFEADLDEGDESLMVTLAVECDQEAIYDLQAELALHLADAYGESWRPDVFMFEYQSTSELQ